MKHTTTAALAIVAATTALFGSTVAAGATTRGATAGPPVRKASHVLLSLGAPAIKPGQPADILVTVTPRLANRIVTLKRDVDGNLVGAAVARTNRLGNAVFHLRFARAGSVRMRAFVEPSTHFSAGFSPSVVEDVAVVLPIILRPGVELGLGSTGANVLLVQQRLSALGYWLGTPNGTFGDSTQQAIYALQKAAGLPRTGVMYGATLAALNAGDVPTPRSTSGNVIDVDLSDDLLMIVQNGKLFVTLNTSTGGGYTYVEKGVTDVATTPTGVFAIGSAVNGTVTDPLGILWRPRFFYEGYAIHGDSYVPPYPESHGCVRVSNEAIDWIWASNVAPIGTEVWIY